MAEFLEPGQDATVVAERRAPTSTVVDRPVLATLVAQRGSSHRWLRLVALVVVVAVAGIGSGKIIGAFDGIGSPVFQRGRTIVFSPEGTHFATTDGDALMVWELDTGKQVGTTKHGVSAMAFGPDGMLATGDSHGTIRLWRLPGL